MSDSRQSTQREELLARLDLIEEQARLTIAEFPVELRQERQRMIIALARDIRSAATSPSLAIDPEDTVRLSIP